MKLHMKTFIRSLMAGALYCLCNYFIANIPLWTIRKTLYRLLGMKIGKNSRIMMKTIVTIPWRIEIGKNSYINEFCYLDGRGGLKIGDNVSIALFSMIITGTHDKDTVGFDLSLDPIIIEDFVWIAARAMVLNGALLRKGCIIGAGSLVTPRSVCAEYTVYVGNPATAKGVRTFDDNSSPKEWKVHFR